MIFLRRNPISMIERKVSRLDNRDFNKRFLFLGADEKKDHLNVMKENFNPLQVGMTNQSPASVKRLPHSPILPANDALNTPSPILKPPRTFEHISKVPNRPMLTTRIRKQGQSKVSILFSIDGSVSYSSPWRFIH